MSDLIRRDELLKKECCGRISGDDVRNAPAVDAVEVVRCKDCEYLRILDFDNIYARCYRTNCMFYQKTHTLFAIDAKNHYCSLGKRREENAETDDR